MKFESGVSSKRDNLVFLPETIPKSKTEKVSEKVFCEGSTAAMMKLLLQRCCQSCAKKCWWKKSLSVYWDAKSRRKEEFPRWWRNRNGQVSEDDQEDGEVQGMLLFCLVLWPFSSNHSFVVALLASDLAYHQSKWTSFLLLSIFLLFHFYFAHLRAPDDLYT